MTGRLALLVLAAGIAIGACSARPSQPVTPIPTGSVTPIPTNPTAACPAPSAPGPADEPPRAGGDLIDVSDWGGGRWRLCLTEPGPATAEGTVWCVWTPDRSTVIELNARPIKMGALDFETYVSFNGSRFELHALDLGGTVANYEPGPVLPTGTSSDRGRSGSLAFEVVLRVDPETGAAAGVAPEYSGVMTWQCGDSPPAG